MSKSTIQFYPQFAQRGKRTVDKTERRLEDSQISDHKPNTVSAGFPF